MPNGKDKGFIDWNVTPMIQPEDPRSQSLNKPLGVPTLKKGEGKPPGQTNEQIAKIILGGRSTQPTDQQLFGHLVPTEEQVAKADDQWNNCFNNFYTGAKKPIESQSLNKSWGSRGPIWKEEMTEEEKRISAIPVSAGLTDSD